MDELDLQPVERDEIPASELGLESTPALRPGVGAAFLDDEGVLLDPATGGSHVLDQPAALVTRFLDGTSTLGEIAFDISDVLGVDRAQVESDVLTLVKTLGVHGLIDGVARVEHLDHASAARAPEGVPVGADLSGWSGWEAVGEGRRLLVNWGTRCGFCSRIAADLAELEPALRAAGTELLLVTVGDRESLASQLGDVVLPVLHVEEVPEFFVGLGTPVAYVVDADRTVAEPISVGAFDVPVLARRLAEGPTDGPAEG